MPDAILECNDLTCEVVHSRNLPSKVDGLSLVIEAGSMTIVRGDVTSGKYLLLQLLSLQQRPDRGEIILDGLSTTTLDDETRVELQAKYMGFVFDSPYLLPQFSVAENIAMTVFKRQDGKPVEAQRLTESIMDYLGLSDLQDYPVGELSAMEKHVVALARSVVLKPALLMVENAGAKLQVVEKQALFEITQTVVREIGATLIWATDDDLDADGEFREITMNEGRIGDNLGPVTEPRN